MQSQKLLFCQEPELEIDQVYGEKKFFLIPTFPAHDTF
jgi:hypothetical protein